MANYPGNAALAPAVRDRVLSTFQQTLTLYKAGRYDEVIQGCGLILRMDPMFDPAKKLLEKTRNPAAPVDVDALLPAGGVEPAGDPMREAREAMAARDFQRVVNVTTEVLTNDLLNDEARVLNEQAREKMEAAPFVEQFARKFDQQLANGNATGARAEIEKARALDPDHPAIKRMQTALAGAAPPASPPAPPPAAPSFGFNAPAPSFVVDNKPPPTSSPSSRPAAQATDFGFTFEEEKAEAPGGFSFDAPAQSGGFALDAPSAPAADPFAAFQPQQTAPPAPAAPPAASFSFDEPAAAPAGGRGGPPAGPPAGPHTFDFSTAAVETTPDDQKKIAQYLSDGDRAFDTGDYQKAIDLWSRIFLIDVTNDDASQRIEKAKARRREVEQQVEGVLADAIAAYEKRNYEAARAKFDEVLRVDPTNQAAQEYLDRLGQTGSPAAAAHEIPPSPVTTRDIFAEDELIGGETLVPPEPAVAPRAAPAKKKAPAPSAAAGTRKIGATTLIIILAVAALLAAGGWFVWSKYIGKPSYDPAATEAIFRQADTLAKSGKYDRAITALQDVKPDDPQHDRALMMIADLQKKKGQASEMVDGRPAALVYQEDLANGRQAFEAHDYDAAKKALDAAARIKPLPPELVPLYEQAVQQAAKLDSAKALFKEEKYSDAIANLQPLLASDPQNRSIQRIITDAHFNLGAQALQDERTDRTADAIREFDEVLKVDPTDELARRSRALAERYNGQPKDLLYKIYVKYLPLRRAT